MNFIWYVLYDRMLSEWFLLYVADFLCICMGNCMTIYGKVAGTELNRDYGYTGTNDG